MKEKQKSLNTILKISYLWHINHNLKKMFIVNDKNKYVFFKNKIFFIPKFSQ